MRFLVVDDCYRGFLNRVYADQPDMAGRPFADQLDALAGCCFATAPFYARHLTALGHETHATILNALPLQQAWLAEHGPRRSCETDQPYQEILAAQVERLRPDVLVILEMARLSDAYLKALRPHARFVVGQIACPIRQQRDWTGFDFVLSSLPNYVDLFRQHGKAAERFLLGFEASILEQLSKPQVPGSAALAQSSAQQAGASAANAGPGGRASAAQPRSTFEPTRPSTEAGESGSAATGGKRGQAPREASFPPCHGPPAIPSQRPLPLVHVGGAGPVHAERNELLERLCRRFDLALWGYDFDGLPADSTMRRRYRGEAWGIEMFRIMASARIVPNKHVTAVADGFANNCRLYEATGVGALLVTDNKRNLAELFEPGREIVAYDAPQDCEEKIAYYLDHADEAAAIAAAGQRRTLRDHTYAKRMAELVEIVRRCL